MENITAISVCISYGLAFAMIWLGNVFLGRSRQLALVPPALPLGKVSVWVYKPFDLFGLVAIAGVFFMMMMLGFLAERLEPKPVVEKELAVSVETLVFSIGFQIFVAGAAIAIVARRVNLVHWLGLRWKQWPLVIAIAPVTVLLMWTFFAGMQAAGLMELLEKLGVKKVQDTVVIFQEEKDMVVVGLMAFAAMIVAPICEEIVFRGYLYPVAKKFAGPWLAAIASALIFSAAHGSMSALLPLFVFGVVLVALYEFTGSIWAPMAVHCLFNSATVAIQMLVRFGYIPDGVVQ
ncbi:MAG: CPBP family intramembrane metalloprotease [Akkermansiaceae bacterium]|jgi:membrane protease YdiL (CAAX protease family)|nr:CPBP family intramembrane metalloprotease [Akkermansiaceae bacterium]MDP4645990.1 CPBP family intramembrane metalloprotease [Akkermansiaceae bacterium]MDP4721858.1 CPBP family intramembrane metalloprotease [Akkermansiaceae bacterium]MDP4781200.1 CPBP family intramembrane metalloprotease [Akkermansiaceae bacterium]MDP4848565.1 CPBP family intramembrane metalloprotease [Akkermansiaceae bacterium]